MIQKALEKNRAAKQMIDELAKEGGILQRGWNRVKEILEKNPWMLYVLLGIGAIAIAGIKAGLEEMSYSR